jgi:hypothetical protein
MGYGSSIAQNCSISGERAGFFIGENAMIALQKLRLLSKIMYG